MTRESTVLPPRMLAAVAWGTLLNPLNSSMIAVALVPIQTAFRVSVGDATWLVSGFYLAGAVGQPLMGRLADRVGPRRVFVAGLTLAALAGALGPLAPSIGWLAGIRVLQALGTSGAFPSGMAMFRARVGDGARPPARALAVVSIAANVSAAVGPTLGGLLVEVAGWPAIFLVNLPAAGLCALVALRWLPADPPNGWRAGSLRSLAGIVDLPGVVLFGAAIGGLLAFLLSLAGGPRWPLLAMVPAAAAGLVWRELRAEKPFLDVRMLAPGRGLAGVYAQFTAVNLVFYSIFFGLPLWLEEVRGLGPGQAGLVVMPFAGLGVLATVVAARLIERWGARPPLVLGSAVLAVGVVLLLVLGPATSLAAVVGVVAVLGLPNGLLNLGLQALLFGAAQGGDMGAASGLFQTCRYVGSVLSTSLLGVVFADGVTSTGLHRLSVALAAISVALLAASAARLLPRPGRPPEEEAPPNRGRA